MSDDKLLRVFNVTTDALGIDPLRDKTVASVQAISRYTVHLVSAEENGAPDLIALNTYGNERYWWVIMCYNGLCLYSEVQAGVALRLPDLSSLVSAIGSNSVRPSKITRIVMI